MKTAAQRRRLPVGFAVSDWNPALPDGPAGGSAVRLAGIVKLHLCVFRIPAGRCRDIVRRARAPDIELMFSWSEEVALFGRCEIGGNCHSCDRDKNSPCNCR